ncbi:hypothetical protein LguiB_006354 [Lonicera macranthoides]
MEFISIAQGGFNSSKKESEDEMQKLESENQTLMLKERVSKQELQDAHKEAFETASQICGGYFAIDFVDGFENEKEDEEEEEEKKRVVMGCM